MNDQNNQQSDASLADFSMSKSDQEVLETIYTTLNTLRAFMVRTIGSADVISFVLEESEKVSASQISPSLQNLARNAKVVQATLEHIRQHLEKRLNTE